MPTWLTPQVLKMAGIGLLVAGNALFFGLYRHESNSFENFRTEVKAAAAAQEEKTKQTTIAQERVNKESTNVYKANSAAVSNYYSRMLNNSGSSNVPSVSIAPAGANAIPSYPVFVGQCAQTTLQLASLQKWINDQSEVMK